MKWTVTRKEQYMKMRYTEQRDPLLDQILIRYYAPLQQIGGAEYTFPACISIKPVVGSKCFKRCMEINHSDGNSEVEVDHRHG